MNKILLILLLIIVGFNKLQSQDIKIGRVVDFETKKPIKVASIHVVGTSVTVNTNALGYFQLELDSTKWILIESDEYEPVKIKVPTSKGFQIGLNRIILDKNSTRYEKGEVKGNKKIGIWDYYDKPGILSMRVDYDAGQILYIKNDYQIKYPVEIDGVYIESDLDFQPRYHGSWAEFYRSMNQNITFPKQAFRAKVDGTLYVMFEVDTLGHADNFTIIHNIEKNCGEEAIRLLKLFQDRWVVAKKGEMKFKSRYIMPFTFRVIKDSDGSSSNHRKVSVMADLPVATMLYEVVVEASGAF